MGNERVSPLRIGFWGTHGLFSNYVLTALQSRYGITAIALPAGEPLADAVALWKPPTAPIDDCVDDLLIVNPYVAPDTLQTAWQHKIPTYQLQRLRAPEVRQWLIDLALDVVCVACFPWRIPAALLALPAYGFLNLHPSLLPAYRGPAPLFWQLRAGLRTSGVTLHWMDADFDTGVIAAQRPLALPDGASSTELDRLYAETGADLLCAVLQQLDVGSPPRRVQPVGGSQQSWPAADDFRLSLDWSARHAYNFMRGTAVWQQPYPVRIGNEELWLRSALAFDVAQTLALPLVRNGAELLIQFQPGVLRTLAW